MDRIRSNEPRRKDRSVVAERALATGLFARIGAAAPPMIPRMRYQAAGGRYGEMQYRRSGRSGLLLPLVSLGLWQNFGDGQPLESQRAMLRRAFDRGITHFDLGNNYGPPYGAAEQNFGRVFDADFRPYRNELVISTKAGYDMWPGPYGEWGSRKYLIASLDQSLSRMGLDYVDIFYSHGSMSLPGQNSAHSS
jgi:L-glyceraldehyde 3-phosphate reductase